MKLPAVIGMVSEKISAEKVPREVSNLAVGLGMEISLVEVMVNLITMPLPLPPPLPLPGGETSGVSLALLDLLDR
jgi:hypothetical protein